MTTRNFGLLFEIDGWDYALVSHKSIIGAQQYAVNDKTLVRIADIPSSITLGVDPYTGKTDKGGTRVPVTHLPEAFNEQKGSPVATLLQDVTAGAGSIRVPDASIFTIPGYLWIGKEAVQATGTVSGSGYDDITVSRAQLGSKAAGHAANSNVYGFCPSLLFRRCTLTWCRLDDYGIQIQRFVGYVEKALQTGQGVSISVVSGQQQIDGLEAFGGDYAEGTLREGFAFPGGSAPLPKGQTTSAEEFVVRLKNKSAPFPIHGYKGGQAFPSFLQIGGELIQYQFAQHPLYEFEVQSVTGNALTLVQTSSRQGDAALVKKGDILDLEDSTGALLTGGEGLQVVSVTTPTSRTATFVVSHNGNLTVSATDVVVGRYQQLIRDAHQIRAVDNTQAQTHEAEAQASEVRKVEGDALYLLRIALFSLAGDGTNGPDSGLYDVLPEGWGLGFDSAEVDNSSLDALAPFSTSRRYYLKSGVKMSDLVQWFSTALNCFLVFCEDGKLRAVPRGDVYPNQGADHTVGLSQLTADELPAMPIDLSLVKNTMRVETDFNLEGVAQRALTLKEQESINLFGELPIHLKDPGLTQAGGAAVLVPMLTNLLKSRSFPLSRFSVQVLLDPEVSFRPGQTASFTLPHYANLQGEEGYSAELFEILRSQPVDRNALVELELLQKRQSADLARVCFSAIVQSVAGAVLTLEPSSVTHFAPADPDFEPSNGDGTEDVDWFLEDDPVTLWDASSFSSTLATHDTTIVNIDPTLRTIELASTPGSWTIAAGDIVRLDRWQDVGAGPTSAERQEVFLALADDTTEQLSPSDNPKRWGL